MYYNGDNVYGDVFRDYASTDSIMQGVGPLGFSMTLFQSLAFAAGFDPAKGPGSSCSTDGSSSQCVLPWAGGTKSVSSVVLIANGVSFAVSSHTISLLLIY